MPRFAILLRRNFSDGEDQPSLTQLQDSIRLWQEWYRWIILEQRMDDPFRSWDRSGKIAESSQHAIDGPYLERGDALCGLLIIRALNYEEALDIASRCPILPLGGTVEIRMEIQTTSNSIDYF